ncbi:TPA: hypothetical protein N0F65_003506 [Lagenidium giganteum]|uniref:DDE Tnp4 domain-containing protein n=1 Tax=Lagenidium giganteum TaxID=4803 RepID=A0AAV2YK78_9STRA|nr:TPA: hypothetical protein N0F65_003506 [Lagenidium giganteum]
MEGSDSEDEAWMAVGIAVALHLLLLEKKAFRPRARRSLVLTDADDRDFFAAVYECDSTSRFRDVFRCSKPTFDKLHCALSPYLPQSEDLYTKLMVGFLLHRLGNGATVREQESVFHVSSATIHRHRLRALRACILALASIIQVRSSVPLHFATKFPFLSDALVAIDGVHVPVMVPDDDQEAWRNQKGWLSTNTLIACDWELRVAFVYPGVEGSAHDSNVLYMSQFLSDIPSGYYCLADAGYGMDPKVLTPYRNVRYHLKEWGESRPQNLKELFNLCHAKARNAVKRVIGILKRRFAILRRPMECELTTSVRIIYACCMIHNLIRSYDHGDFAED